MALGLKETAQELHDTKSQLLDTIHSQTTWNEKEKKLARQIISTIQPNNLPIECLLKYSDYSLKKGDIQGMGEFIQNLCNKINSVSPSLQFLSQGMFAYMNDKQISFKIKCIFKGEGGCVC